MKVEISQFWLDIYGPQVNLSGDEAVICKCFRQAIIRPAASPMLQTAQLTVK
jgi:hypothetical protein